VPTRLKWAMKTIVHSAMKRLQAVRRIRDTNHDPYVNTGLERPRLVRQAGASDPRATQEYDASSHTPDRL
jgi:hypothetical protein